tara:strand:+ start:1778 stop:3709 length:1932 start_codon:yes stop_codon:yes gene_type:complete
MANDTRDDQENLYGSALYWQQQLDQASQYERDWRERGGSIIDRYRDERQGVTISGSLTRRFNILWSNTETLKSALFARMAKPDVRRRFHDPNPAGRQVAILLERALQYELDTNRADIPIGAALEDYLLPGRGVVWVVYEPVLVTEKVTVTVEDADGEEIAQQSEEEVERLGDQRCRFEYVHWEDYRESPSRRSEDAIWRARRHLFTRDDLISRGFENAEDIPLNWMPETNQYNENELYNRAEVWEIWDKVKRKRLYIATGYRDVLAEDDDPYNLEGFYPCPAPLIAVSTTDTSIPVPEYTLYQDQAEELDRLTTRITFLIEGLKRRGVYDASVPELAHLANAGDNEFVPSENFASLAQRGGLEGSFQTEPIGEIASVVNGLYQQRNAVLQIIYEVTGISDILRGSTRASETATAQQLKARFGSMRLRRRQDDIQRYIRDLFRIKAELISENYEPDILQRMTNLEVTDEMMEIMRSDKLRSYVIDVQTDSTVFEDEAEEKKTRMEFANVIGAYLVKAVEVTQAAPELTPLAFDIVKFVAGGWKIGRTFEDTIDQTEAAIMGQLQASRQQPQVNPEQQMQQEKLAAQMQMEQLRQQGKLADISSRERAESVKVQEEGRASSERVRSKEDLAMLEAELKMAEGQRR